MTTPSFDARAFALGLLGAVVGSLLGYFIFMWMARQNFYALMIPPGLLGWAAGLGARRRIMPLAIFCGVAGLALGIFTEWRYAPFKADRSLSYFLTHLHDLRPVTLIMLLVGSFLAFYLALGRDGARKPA